MSYITTYTGKHFDPIHPDTALIDIRDIAHALALICRANGHARSFYSVAQHSLACAREAGARGLPQRVQLACLLHDASEAYLSDVTRPIKGMLTTYLQVEERLQQMIWLKYLGVPLAVAEEAFVHEIDDDMLAYEFHQLMPEDISAAYRKIIADVDCTYQDMAGVEREFSELAESLKG